MRQLVHCLGSRPNLTFETWLLPELSQITLSFYTEQYYEHYSVKRMTLQSRTLQCEENDITIFQEAVGFE